MPERKRPLRIALIAPPWVPVPPPAFGGVEAMLDALARGLHDAGHEVLLFTTGESTCPVERTHYLPRASGTDMDAAVETAHAQAGYSAASEWGAEVIHDHTAAGPTLPDAPACPLVVTAHQPFTGDFGAIYARAARRGIVVAVSLAQAASSSTRVDAVVHNAVRVRDVPTGAGHGGYALFLGRMSQTKGVDIAVRVARAAGIPLKIAVKMREPNERAFFREQVEPLLGPETEMVGEVSFEAKWELLGDAVCLLNPVRWEEPFGMVMIEALATGTPVVATPRGAAPEIVRNGVTGFLSGAEDELAQRATDAALLARDECRNDASARFDVTRLVREYVGVYTHARKAAGFGGRPGGGRR